jgi:hypothetical protein
VGWVTFGLGWVNPWVNFDRFWNFNPTHGLWVEKNLLDCGWVTHGLTVQLMGYPLFNFENDLGQISLSGECVVVCMWSEHFLPCFIIGFVYTSVPVRSFYFSAKRSTVSVSYLVFLFVFGVPVDNSVYSIISRALFCTRMRLGFWVSDCLFYSQSMERTFVYLFHQENKSRIFRLSRIEEEMARWYRQTNDLRENPFI